MSQSIPCIIGNDFVSVVVDNRPYNLNADHPFYQEIKDAIKRKDWDFVRQNVDVSRKIAAKAGSFEVDENGGVFYKGRPIHNTITGKILSMFREGYDTLPLLKFLDLLDQNPSKESVGELYYWLEAGGMPITEDGHILAYKAITDDYKDCYTRTIDNHIGAVVQMDRAQVTADRNVTCARGLHFCSIKYLRETGYGGTGRRVVIVKINPMNVVSVPNDYKDTKGRCCEYTVVGEVENFDEVTKNGERDILREQEVHTNEEIAAKFNGIQMSEPEPEIVFETPVSDVLADAKADANPAAPQKRDAGGRFLPKKNPEAAAARPAQKRDKSGLYLPSKNKKRGKGKNKAKTAK